MIRQIFGTSALERARFEDTEWQHYSPPEEPPRGHRCAVCGDDFYGSEVTAYPNGDEVCESCGSGYVWEHSAPYRLEYVRRSAGEAYRLWIGSLTREEQDREAANSVAFRRFLSRPAEDTSWLVEEACREDGVFLRYAAARLMEEEWD